MFHYTIRRVLIAIPTLLVISFVIFSMLTLAPNDPTSQLPLTIPPEVREIVRQSLGLGEPFPIRYLKWLHQFFINEPLSLLHASLGIDIGDSSTRPRVTSWSTRSPIVDLIADRLPQTLKVVGLSYLVGIIIALPIGVISAYKKYSWFDQIGSLISMIGFSVPTFFSGLLLIIVFSVNLQWFPSVYDTSLQVKDWTGFVQQMKQMAMPVAVLGLYNAATISRFMRASMLENLQQDYVRTARAKGMTESVVVFVHVLRNSLIPVVTVIALGVPQIFGGAIVTEQIFRVNGLGQLLINGIQGADLPLVQTLTFIFAVLIIVFNLVADVLYGILDPRIRYD